MMQAFWNGPDGGTKEAWRRRKLNEERKRGMRALHWEEKLKYLLTAWLSLQLQTICFIRFIFCSSNRRPHAALMMKRRGHLYNGSVHACVSVWSAMLECVDAITKFTVSDKGCHHRHGNTCAAERERRCDSVRERESRRQIRLFSCQLFPPPANSSIQKREGGKQYKMGEQGNAAKPLLGHHDTA